MFGSCRRLLDELDCETISIHHLPKQLVILVFSVASFFGGYLTDSPSLPLAETVLGFHD